LKARDFVQLLRPWQWSKNLILFAGLVFSVHLLEAAYATRALVAFAVFCMASSAVYILNDVFDVNRDRVHPRKRLRPLPAGRISLPQAGVLCAGLTLIALIVGYRLGSTFFFSLGIFFLLNIAYSANLKNLVILDVLLIAMSFVVRAIAGVMALRPLDPAIVLSPWLLVCTLFLALFLGFGKRRHELSVLEETASDHRATLGQYSRPLLDQLITVVTGATLIAYAIYTIAPATVTKFHSPALVFTIPFVVYGLFRYLYLIQVREEGGSPSRTLYRDVPILLTTLGWMVTVVVVIYASRLR
jgi:4-hydroxybenzoate polyprenyltransferase